jgi:hypothetical protein
MRRNGDRFSSLPLPITTNLNVLARKMKADSEIDNPESGIPLFSVKLTSKSSQDVPQPAGWANRKRSLLMSLADAMVWVWTGSSE